MSSSQLAERFDELQVELGNIYDLINDPELQARSEQNADQRMAIHALATKNELYEVAKEHQKLASALLLELKIRRDIPLF